MTTRQNLLLPLAFAGSLLMVACQGGSSPTETTLPKAAPAGNVSAAGSAATADASGDGLEREGRPGALRASRTAAARATNPGAPVAPEAQPAGGTEAIAEPGRGNGNGNGGNGGGNGNGHGNGGNGGHGGSGDLSLQMQPDTWNTNWEHSHGTVSALVRGGDISKIDKSSIKLVGDGGKEVAPTRVQTAGGQLRALFLMSEAIAAIDTTQSDPKHKVTLKFTNDGAATTLEDTIRVVGPRGGDDGDDDDEGEIELEIQPDTWNTNWSHSQGTVSALLRGDVADIDLDSIVLVGDGGKEVKPVDVKRTGHQVRARFPKADALASLDDPDPGERHEVKVKFTVAGTGGASTAKELTDKVRIVGPGDDD
ncbi:MAG TPA: hypothetical protein VGV61_10840 [Thermoanaerobaculia bacterium]|jgi:hypothetical protein|nr:hypothetical protein [Thermoanaerobaculia bacterium]